MPIKLDSEDKSENIFLYVNSVPATTNDTLKAYKKLTGKTLRVAAIRDSQYQKDSNDLDDEFPAIICDFDDHESVREALQPFESSLVGLSARRDSNAFALTRFVDALPKKLLVQKRDSLVWSTNKRDMRRQIGVVNENIIPRFMEVGDDFEATIREALETIGLPIMVKPAGLASSLLITACYSEQELRDNLSHAQKEIKKMYEKINRTDKPVIILEQQLNGLMYSVDSYVMNDGSVYHMPVMRVVSATEIGFDDYFGYKKESPTDLTEEQIRAAELATEDAIKGLELRNSTTHCELMLTDEGWYIIEIGPRIGRFRPEVYQLSYGLDHSLNDLLVHLGQKPRVDGKLVAHTHTFAFFPKAEGIITKIEGYDQAEKLESFVLRRDGKIGIGDMARLSKNGGKLVVEFILSHADPEQLAEDVKKLESYIKIETEKA